MFANENWKDSLTSWHLTWWSKMAISCSLCDYIVYVSPANTDHIWVHKQKQETTADLEELGQ